MKISLKRLLIIVIAILQCQFWIVLSRDGFEAVNANDSEDDGNPSTGNGPKNALVKGTFQSSSSIFIPSSFFIHDTSSGLAVDMDSVTPSEYPFTRAMPVLIDANDSEDDDISLTSERPKKVREKNKPQSSSPIFISSSFLTEDTPSGLAVDRDSISHRTQYPFTPGTTVPVDVDSVSLLKTSIQASFTDQTMNHQNYLSESHLVDVPSSYLLNSSPSSDSSDSSENTSYLFDNLSSHISDVNEYLLESSSSKPVVINLYSSHIYQSLPVKGEDVLATVISENIKPTPIAEILTMTTSYTTSSSPSIDDENWRWKKDDSVYLSKEIQPTSTSDYALQSAHFKESHSINEKNPALDGNGDTTSLTEEVNTYFRDFIFETLSATTASSFSDDSTELSSQTVSSGEVLRESNSELMPPSVLTTLVEEINDSNKSYSHEIITDDSSLNNQTSRNEDAEIDDIISGIIHLLAGNVQVARPTNKGFGFNPTRRPLPLQPSLLPTRINNRGPFRPNSASRTVVVFSQPQNNGHPTELALPGHFVPSTIQNPPFIRIRPTKVGEQPPSAVSVIHFYKQGPKPPISPPSPHIPFRGEVFNSNPKPNNNVRITAYPNENVRPSFLNPEQQSVFNGNSQNKYPHFIFSDHSASSVVVIHPSKPPSTETFEKFSSVLQKKENINNKTSSSPSFEVLIDDTMKKKVYVSQAATPSDSYNGFRVKEASDNPKPVGHITSTASGDDIPHGPITDWVPFAERPSAMDTLNETNLSEGDKNVSIIMDPVIFDVTVSDSEKEELSSVVTEVATPNTKQSPFPETVASSSVSKTEHYELSSSRITDEYSNSNEALSQNRNVLNSPRQVSELASSSSFPWKTSDIASTSALNATYIFDFHKPQSTMNSSVIVGSSYSKDIRSSATEKASFIENTEKATLPKNSFNSTPAPPKSSEIAEHITGRPFVIPVDIEDVHPFVGPFNPPGFEKNRNNSNLGSVPGFQRNKPEDPVRKTTTTTTRVPIIRSPNRPRPTNIRIDTCIVGDDNTCDASYNETCRMENGISSCHCRPGYSRSFSRAPCIPIVSLMLSMKLDRFGNRKLTYNSRFKDKNSDDYKIMEFEAKQGLSSLISHIPAFSRTFQGMRINKFYPIGDKVVVNSTIYLEQKESTRTQAVRMRLRTLIGEAVKTRKQNIGDSRLYVDGPFNPIITIEDINECSDPNLNDCSPEGICFNVFGTYLCKCKHGYIDPFVHDERKSGRKCSACSSEYCSFHGKCFVEKHKRYCKCQGNYIGSRCEVDGEVLGVAIGASVAAILIILVTLGCLVIWNRRWKRKQQKAEALSSRSYNSNQTFSYMGNIGNSNTNPYRLTMEDRMRWAHISDVIKVQPNQMIPRLSPLSPGMDQTSFSNRCPAEDDLSWYECRSRPRSRAMKSYGGIPVPSCFEMDISSGGSHYGGPSAHTSKRSLPKRPVSRY